MKKLFFTMLMALGLTTTIYAGLNTSAFEKKKQFKCKNEKGMWNLDLIKNTGAYFSTFSYN